MIKKTRSKSRKSRVKKKILIGVSILIVLSIGIGALAFVNNRSVVMDDHYKQPKAENNNSKKIQTKHAKSYSMSNESNVDDVAENKWQASNNGFQEDNTNSNPGPHTKEWYEDRRDEGRYQVWYSPDNTGDYMMVKNLETGQIVRKKAEMNPDWDYVHDRQIAYW